MTPIAIPSRRRFVRGAACAAALAACGRAAFATPAVGRIVVGFPPGGMPDVLARRVGEALQGGYAQAMTVDNKTGAGGQLAISDALRSPTDGSTLLFTPGSMLTIYPHTYKRLPYDPVADLVPVCLAGTLVPAVAVGPSVPASVTGMRELLAWVKANPAEASFGSPGPGSVLHFVGTLLSQTSSVELRHVPYRGTQPALLDLLAGRLPILISTQGEFLAQRKAGALRILGVASPERSRALPDVPTLAEQGYAEASARDFMGFFLPRGASQKTAQTAELALRGALANPAVLRGMEDTGVEPGFAPGPELGRLVHSELERWRPIVKKIGFTADS